MNKTNFGLPSASVFAGKLTVASLYSEAPNVSNLTSTIPKNKQIQFAMKLIL